MARTIFVSNRLPVTVRRSTRGTEMISSAGGLVAGLGPVHERGDGLWFGHLGGKIDSEVQQNLDSRRLRDIPIPAREYRSYYEGYSNSALWPLFHYLLEYCRFDAEEFAAYEKVNRRFADAILEEAQPGDTIWIHDYQLMLVPQLVRQRSPNVRIGFFLHIPFPSSEVLRVLPQRERILRGLLGADLIGVHTYEYADHLLRSFRRVLGLEATGGAVLDGTRPVRVETHPLGIEAARQQEIAFSEAADEHYGYLKERMRGRRVILGVDRLDYTKGLPLKFQAWRKLLEQDAKWAENAVLVQVAVPSRENVIDYARQRHEVERLTGEVNGLFGSPGQVPIHYIYRSVPPEELGALYRLADVALITPLRDGLNLVAKEYVACRTNGDGVLALSEFAGAASELGEALRINPWDIERTASQLQRALTMSPAEQRERMEPMHRRVHEYDVHHWVEQFMRSLNSTADTVDSVPPRIESGVLGVTIGPRFAEAKKPLVLLDYDGSLREFTDRYEDAVPTDEIKSILTDLGQMPGVALYINSGRDRDTLGEWFGDLPVSLIAEHGSWERDAGDSEWRRLGPAPDLSWKKSVRPVLEEYTRRAPGARVEEKSSSLVWHYRQVEPVHGEWQALELISVLENLLGNSPVQILSGARVVEVRQQGLTKGRAYDMLIDEMGPFDFVLATGDDRTDEDLFERLDDRAFSIHVGAGASGAQVSVNSPASVRRLLRALINARNEATG